MERRRALLLRRRLAAAKMRSRGFDAQNAALRSRSRRSSFVFYSEPRHRRAHRWHKRQRDVQRRRRWRRWRRARARAAINDHAAAVATVVVAVADRDADDDDNDAMHEGVCGRHPVCRRPNARVTRTYKQASDKAIDRANDSER